MAGVASMCLDRGCDHSATIRAPAVADQQAYCRRLQDPTLANLLKFVWARRSHNTATGKLLDHPNPTPADLARAFPLAPPNYTALANPAGEELHQLQLTDLYISSNLASKSC